MVRQHHAHHGQSFLRPVSGGVVTLGGQRHAAGVVMRQYDGAGTGEKCVFHQAANIQIRRGDAALPQLFAGQKLALAVQAELVDYLVLLTCELLQQICPRPLGGVQHQFLSGIRQSGLAVELRRQLQQNGSALPDALHLFQILHRGIEDGGQGAVPLHQGVGDGIRISPGDGIIQQQFQGLVIRESVQAAFQKSLPHLLSVSVMDAHRAFPPPAWGRLFFGILYYITEPHSLTRYFCNSRLLL